jgi:hypothetical protein
MPSYKIVGIYSFAKNLLDIKLNDPVILRKEENNIKSKNAIGVYFNNDKKIGYLPIENKSEVNKFNNSYKISKLILNKEYPVVEISRTYDNTSILSNCEFPWEKKIKYPLEIINLTSELEKSLTTLIKYLNGKRIKIKKALITFANDNYTNLVLETAKGIQTFYTITYNYFLKNSEYYDELLELNLIDNAFYKDLMFYRIENYYETNYKNIIDLNVDIDIDLEINEKQVHEPLVINKKDIDTIFNIINIYWYCLYKNDMTYIDNYNSNLLPKNLDVTKKYFNSLELNRGNFYYDHKYKIYSWIEWLSDNKVFMITSDVSKSNLINLYLTQKKDMILYNPLEGKEIHIKLNNYDYMNFLSEKN